MHYYTTDMVGHSHFTPLSITNVMSKLAIESFDSTKELEELEHTFAHFPEAVLITDHEAKILYVNSAFEQLTGYSLAEVQDTFTNILNSKKTPPEVISHMKSNLRKGKSFASDEVVNIRKDGTEYCAHCFTFPIMHHGETYYFIQIQKDITQQKHIEEFKREFLAFATHELKTPLTTLLLIAQSKVRSLEKTKASQKDLDTFRIINSELHRLTRLIEDLSDYSRIETGKFRLRLDKVEMNELIHKIVKQISMTTKSHTIIFRKTYNTVVFGDADRLEQVLINFLTNAVKYSPKGTHIEVMLERKGRQAVISLKHHGEGISPENVKLIFEKFYQVNNGRQKGMGLGLFLCKEIVTQHKGKIWVTSQLGQGSTFYFSLPYCIKCSAVLRA